MSTLQWLGGICLCFYVLASAISTVRANKAHGIAIIAAGIIGGVLMLVG